MNNIRKMNEKLKGVIQFSLKDLDVTKTISLWMHWCLAVFQEKTVVDPGDVQTLYKGHP